MAIMTYQIYLLVLDIFPILPCHTLLRLPLLAEYISVPSQEDIITLVVQRDYLAALELGLRWEEREEETGSQETEGGAEVVED